MQIRSAIIVTTLAGVGLVAPAAAQTSAPPAPPAAAPKVADAELNAAKAIGTAPDGAAMVAAASAFMQKYPQSTLTRQIAQRVAAKVSETTDPADELKLALAFRAAFPGAAEADLVLPLVVEADVKLNKVDDAFKETQGFLSRHPDDLLSLTEMSIVGAEQAKRGNPKYAAESETNALKAIAMIEADQRPATFDDALWTEYKTKRLALLYQSVGMFSMMGGRMDEAATRLTKSAAINPKDATTYFLLGTVANRDFQTLNEKYKATPAGPAQDEALKAAYAALDRVIDLYAHAVGLAESDPAFKGMHDMILDDLTKYYTFRHKGTDGLQALIDKYKSGGGLF